MFSVGKRVVVKENSGPYLFKDVVGTIVMIDGESLLVQSDFVDGQPVIEAIHPTKVREAFYSDVRDIITEKLVDPRFHAGRKFKVLNPGKIKKVGLEEGTFITIKDVNLTAEAKTDVFICSTGLKDVKLSIDFLTNNCEPVVEFEFEYAQGQRLVVVKPVVEHGLEVGNIVTVMRQEGAYIDIGVIRKSLEEEEIQSLWASSFKPVTDMDLTLAKYTTFVDPLFHVGNIFKANKGVSNIFGLEGILEDDRVQIAQISNLSHNAFEDIFRVKNSRSGEYFELSCVQLATYFEPLGRAEAYTIETTNPDAHKILDESHENNTTQKFELPTPARTINNNFYKEISDTLLGSNERVNDNFADELVKVLGEEKTAELLGHVKQEIATETPITGFGSDVEFTGLRIRDYQFNIDKGFISQPDIHVACIEDYIKALQKLATVLNRK